MSTPGGPNRFVFQDPRGHRWPRLRRVLLAWVILIALAVVWFFQSVLVRPELKLPRSIRSLKGHLNFTSCHYLVLRAPFFLFIALSQSVLPVIFLWARKVPRFALINYLSSSDQDHFVEVLRVNRPSPCVIGGCAATTGRMRVGVAETRKTRVMFVPISI